MAPKTPEPTHSTTTLHRNRRSPKPRLMFEVPVQAIRKSKRIAKRTKTATALSKKEALGNRTIITRSVAIDLKKEGKENILVARLGGEEMRESNDDDDDDDDGDRDDNAEEREDTVISGTDDEIDDNSDFDSNSESSFVTSLSDSESESHNPEDSVHGELTGDYLHFITGHDLQDSRRISVDSRVGVEGGNVGYESDEGFVVSDGEGESENEDEDENEEEKDENEDESEKGKKRSSVSSLISSASSSSASSSASSSLFVFETPKPVKSTLPSLTSTPITLRRSHFDHLAIITASASEIAEEIADAISLFGRRCNRNAKPLLLRMSREMMCENEILETVSMGRKMGFARARVLEDGSVGWCISAPANRNKKVIYERNEKQIFVMVSKLL